MAERRKKQGNQKQQAEGSRSGIPTSGPEAAELAGRLMRKQAALGLQVGAVFLVLILGIPLLTQIQPEASAVPFLGFPLSWFILGIAFYPITWALSAWFVRGSERLEASEAEAARRKYGR